MNLMTRDVISNTEEPGYVGSALSKLNNLVNCVCLKANFLNFCTTLELIFEYEFPPHEHTALIEHNTGLLIARFINVQNVSYKTAVFDDFCLPELDWELGLIKNIQLLSDSPELSQIGSLSLLFNHVCIEWKNKRRMDIIFSGLEIV